MVAIIRINSDTYMLRRTMMSLERLASDRYIKHCQRNIGPGHWILRLDSQRQHLLGPREKSLLFVFVFIKIIQSFLCEEYWFGYGLNLRAANK